MLDAVRKLSDGLAAISPDERIAVVDTLSEIVGALSHPLIDGNTALLALIWTVMAALPADTEQAFTALAMAEGLPLSGEAPAIDPTRQVNR